MLPINIIANWCSAQTAPDVIHKTLTRHLGEIDIRRCKAGSIGVSWVERTRLNFGGSHWYRIEGSLLLEGRRAILYKPAPDDPNKTYIILIALLPTSLTHLKNRIALLVERFLESSLSPMELQLGGITRKFFDKDEDSISGVGITNKNGDRKVAFQEAHKIFDQHHNLFSDEESPENDFISELYLRLKGSNSEVVVARDGTLTFNNPQVTLDEIDVILSQIANAFQQAKTRDYVTDSDEFYHNY